RNGRNILCASQRYTPYILITKFIHKLPDTIHVEQLAESTETNKEETHNLPPLPNNQIGKIAKNIDKLTTSALYRKNHKLLEA
ncbi:MAG TPA: hypothetical protein P5522_13450, partial [Spirochaetia bacterium]|nr:hypothetical protein [Spirochaetia bacterium]